MRELWNAVRALPAAEWRRAAAIAVLTTAVTLIFPLSAAAQALNVMTRRGQARAAMRRIAGGDAAPATGTLLVLAMALTRVRCDRDDWQSLGPHDAALIAPPCALAVDGDAWLVSLP